MHRRRVSLASHNDCVQALAGERERELRQTWQQLRELKLSFQDLQLEAEQQTQAAQEATQVCLPVIDPLLPCPATATSALSFMLLRHS